MRASPCPVGYSLTMPTSANRRPGGDNLGRGGQFAPKNRPIDLEPSVEIELERPDPPQPAEHSLSPDDSFYLGHADYAIRERIAKDKFTGTGALWFLAQDKRSRTEQRVRKQEWAVGAGGAAATGNWYTDTEVRDLRVHIPNNPSVTPALSRHLAEQPYAYLGDAVLRGRYTDDDTKNYVATHHASDAVRAVGAKLKCLTPESIASLAGDESATVVWRIAGRKDIPAAVEPQLAHHESDNVRHGFARRANTHAALSSLSKDNVKRVSRRASRRFRKLF